MDDNENYPSLIDYLDTGRNGFYLDLMMSLAHQAEPAEAAACKGPYSKTIPARITTDGKDTIERVHLVIQRDRYDPPDSLLSVNNISVTTAWKNAFDFHRGGDHSSLLMRVGHQVDPRGELQAFMPLFVCRETRQWFHPVCPQCGMRLTLCQEDELLEKKGLPSYTGSLARFLYCGTCTDFSESAPFYSRDEVAGMPDIVQDRFALITGWKHLLDTLHDDADLPCRGCPSIDACYGPEALASRRIEPFAFYPFYMLMFPALSFGGAAFLTMIAGGPTVVSASAEGPATPAESQPFLFNDPDRQFLEILYLKLAFLGQVAGQILPDDYTAGLQDVDLSLNSIGVDLSAPGIGLPAYWNFKVRLLDTIGNFQNSPFAPIMPEAPCLHFLGALWFHALLVNANQQADAIFAEVGRLVGTVAAENGPETWDIDFSDPAGVFSGHQIFWSPVPIDLPEKWRGLWQQALHLGFELVQAGLRSAVSWDARRFKDVLDALQQQVKTELFSGAAAAPSDEGATEPSDRIGRVLRGILEKWQAEADSLPEQQPSPMAAAYPDGGETIVLLDPAQTPLAPHGDPPDDLHVADAPDPPVPPSGSSDWDQDFQETVILAAPVANTPSAGMPPAGPGTPARDSQWADDLEETVVLQAGGIKPAPEPSSPVDDMQKTVIISAASSPPESASPNQDADLDATLIQDGAGRPSPTTGGFDADLAATAIVNSGASPDPTGNPPPTDDDLEATMVIHPAGGQPPAVPSPQTAEEDLAATLIQSPTSAGHSGEQLPPVQKGPPSAPVFPQTPSSTVSDQEASKAANEDEDIMEQTIIIRSDVKKE